MRILMATDQWYADLKGGVARIATDMADGLAAAGHEVTVLCPAHPDRPEVVHPVAGVTVRRVLPRSRAPVVLTDVVHTRRAAARLAGERFDVLVAHTCTTAAGLLAAGLDLPLVYVFHADVAREVAYLREVEPPGAAGRAGSVAMERYLRALDRASLQRSDEVVVLSEFSRGLLRDLSPATAHRSVLVPGAVDADVFTPGDRGAARTALAVGDTTRLLFTARRLVTRMGLENLVDAVALLDDVAGLEVRIAGDGQLRGELEARRARLGVGERVRFLGRVPEEELLLLYRAADLFVLPTVAYEGFGLVTAEALASGTPVVGTPVGATPELLLPLEPRLVAESADAPALAGAIRGALGLATPELRARCRAYALERYAWEAVMPQWEEVVVRAAQRRRGTAVRAPAGARTTVIELGSTGVRLGSRPLLTRATRRGGRAGVILYHDPAPAVFEAHVRALARRHPFVAYATLVEALLSRDWSAIPPGALAVTFDDAHRRNAELAPVLAELAIEPTIFVCSAIVGTELPFWWTIPGLDVPHLKTVPNTERLAAVAAAGPDRRPRGSLTPSELEALRGIVHIGSHTRTHPILPRCTDREADEEITRSRLELEALFSVSCLDFAYPNGDYGPREIALLAGAGYRSARTIEPGWVTPETDPFRIPIVPMPDDATVNRAMAQVALSALAPRILGR